MPTPKTPARNKAATPPPAIPRPSRARTAAAPRTKRLAAPVASTPMPPQIVSEDDIRLRAYFLSLERADGCADPVRDWLEAEQELASVLAGNGVLVAARRRRTDTD